MITLTLHQYFVPPFLDGTKIHDIVKIRPLCEVGEELIIEAIPKEGEGSLYLGIKKKIFQPVILAKTQITCIQSIQIYPQEQEIYVGLDWLDKINYAKFAKNEGFKSEEDFWNHFNGYYLYSGFLIHWTDFYYY